MKKSVKWSLVFGAILVLSAIPAIAQELVDNPVTAMRALTTPTQDGVIDADEYPGDPVTITTDNSVNVDWGGANPTVDPEDCSFDIYASWDDDALYIALDVTDDVVMVNGEWWGDDDEMIQIVFAPTDPTPVGKQNGSLSDIVMIPGGDIEWRNRPEGGDVDWGDADISGAWAPTATGYILEMRYPWADFNIVLPAIQVGSQLHALFAVVDKDESGVINVFVIASGRQGENPFENHADLSLLTLAVDPDVDYSGDGYTYQEKVDLGLDPFTPIDPDTSYSGDGWTYQQKKDLGLNPFSADSSGDGVPDLWISQHFDDWVDKALDPTFGSTVLDPDTGFTIRMAYQRRVDPNDPNTWPDLTAVPVSNAATLALLVMVMLGLSALLATAVLKRRTQ